MIDWSMASTIVAPVVTALGVYIIDSRIDQKISKNNDELLRRINGTYVRAGEQKIRDENFIRELGQKLDAAECRLRLCDPPERFPAR